MVIRKVPCVSGIFLADGLIRIEEDDEARVGGREVAEERVQENAIGVVAACRGIG